MRKKGYMMFNADGSISPFKGIPEILGRKYFYDEIYYCFPYSVFDRDQYEFDKKLLEIIADGEIIQDEDNKHLYYTTDNIQKVREISREEAVINEWNKINDFPTSGLRGFINRHRFPGIYMVNPKEYR